MLVALDSYSLVTYFMQGQKSWEDCLAIFELLIQPYIPDRYFIK